MVAEKQTKRTRLEDESVPSTDPKRSIRRRQRRHHRLPRVEDFMDLEASHPYGILPGGNLFMTGTTSGGGGGNVFTNILDGEVCHSILSFCDGPDLARLAQTCRFLYAVSHQLELWRDLVLWYLNESSKRDKQQKVLLDMQPSWKDTYVHLVMQARGNEAKMKPHVPMAVSGAYSDYFYRLHSCRTFCIPRSWLEPADDTDDESPFAVPCIPTSEMTTERFYQEFEQMNRPVVVRQAASTWKATMKWDTEYLKEHTQGFDFRATSGAAPLPAQFSLDAYLKYCNWEHLEEAPLYLFDRTALTPNSTLWKDFHGGDLQATCPYWDREVCPQHDLFALLGEGRRPDHTWWIVGPKRSGSVFHMDPNATHAWNAAIRGRKRWIFYPPGQPPPGVHPSADADQVALPLTVGEWIFQFWPQHVERMQCAGASPDQQPLECTAFPGDVAFVPHGWWHMVINLDEGINSAITHNYVSQSNLPNVLKFLDQKEDQISGCRDRQESIKPHQLHAEFCDVLKHHHPQWLKEALAVPDWTCHAWSNPQQENAKQTTKTQTTEKGKDQNTSSLSYLQEATICRNIMAKAKDSNQDEKKEATCSGGFVFSFL